MVKYSRLAIFREKNSPGNRAQQFIMQTDIVNVVSWKVFRKKTCQSVQKSQSGTGVCQVQALRTSDFFVFLYLKMWEAMWKPLNATF
jgi:hypothetical protein